MDRWTPDRRVALIDGDIVAYACAWVGDDAPDKVAALGAVKQMVLNMREKLALDDCEIFLSDTQNFRKDLAPSYKAHRKKMKKPRYLNDCMEYLVYQWDAVDAKGLEADDLLGIWMTTNPEALLCTIDKDLDQITGWHYNWRKSIVYHVTPEEGERFLWTQMLTGDRADNIAGVRGIGPVKAEKLLAVCPDKQSYKSMVYNLYLDVKAPYKNEEEGFRKQREAFVETYKLLKILTKPHLEENWVDIEEYI